MSAAPLRAAVVGCGRIGAQFGSSRAGAVLCHAAAYASSPLTELVAVCDSDRDLATAAAQMWGAAEAFDALPRLLSDTAPEIVSVCTPDDTHAALTMQILACPSVRGVVIEKPVATSLADASRVAALAAQRPIATAVNYSRRWSKPLRELAELIRSGRLGAVRRVSGAYANGWLHNGTHWIDLARMVIGEIAAVRSLAESRNSNSTDSTLDVEIEFASGARGVVFGHARQSLSFFELDAVCEHGRIRVTDGGASIEVTELRPSPIYDGFVVHQPVSLTTAPLDGVLLAAIEEVATCVRTGSLPACTLADGVHALRIATAARDSAGSWSRVNEAAPA